MTRWLALLRAVNVGGTGKLLMDDFKAALADAGLQHVESHLASGNIVFESELPEDQLVSQFNDILQSRFHISGERTLLRDAHAMSRVVKHNPFTEAVKFRSSDVHVHFLAKLPQSQAAVNLTSYKGSERLRLEGQQLYIEYTNGSGTSDLTPRFLEMALGCQGTARNWNTVTRLHEMLQA